ncbi:hypothetical protein BGX27_008142 [Mortierella sp. AM989]|nr:hypothetical protein BGX27_008142 [Mortierella sp. AM989]
MIRISTALAALVVVAMTNQTILLSHAIPQDASATTPQGCVIATPQESDFPQVGKPYTVRMTGCSGTVPVQLRRGDPRNLETMKVPACTATNLGARSCTFTPTVAGPGYSFSAIDKSGDETFSGPFLVKEAPTAPEAVAKKSGRPAAPAPEAAKPEAKAMPVAKKSMTAMHKEAMRKPLKATVLQNNYPTQLNSAARKINYNMTRISTALVALTVVLASFTQASPAPLLAHTSTSGCTILTPQRPLLEGRRYEVHIKGCRGRGDVQLRYGSSSNLSTDEVPACSNVDFSTERCIFTPSRPGTGFSFSTIDNSKGQETFSAQFKVLPKSAVPSTSDPAGPVTPNQAGTPSTPKQETASVQNSDSAADTKEQPKTVVPVDNEVKPATALKKRALYNLS